MEFGRSKNDIQFFYVNKRPIDIIKIAKLINTIYRSNINRHKYPIIILNIQLLTNKYDINIDPNKRSIFIQNENKLYEQLSIFFNKLYEPQNMSYNVKSLDSFITIKTNTNTNTNTNIRKRKLSNDNENIHSKSPTCGDHKEPPNKLRKCSNNNSNINSNNAIYSNDKSDEEMNDFDENALEQTPESIGIKISSKFTYEMKFP